MSPLARQIYQILARQRRAPNPLISYGDLARALGPLPPSGTHLRPNDPQLFEALEEVFRFCRSNRPPLPALTSLAVRRNEDGSLHMPGNGYFALVFPQARDEATRFRLWRDEVGRVVDSPYPGEQGPPPFPSPVKTVPVPPNAVPGWLREPTVIAAIIGLIGTLATLIVTMWVSSRDRGTPASKADDRPVVVDVRQVHEPRQFRADPAPAAKAPRTPTLDDILATLERHHQRATFGAVAGLLGRDPQSLFNGRKRTSRTAWVVNKSTGLPTGTKESDYPDGLLQNPRVIETVDELRVWVGEHP